MIKSTFPMSNPSSPIEVQTKTLKRLLTKSLIAWCCSACFIPATRSSRNGTAEVVLSLLLLSLVAFFFLLFLVLLDPLFCPTKYLDLTKGSIRFRQSTISFTLSRNCANTIAREELPQAFSRSK